MLTLIFCIHHPPSTTLIPSAVEEGTVDVMSPNKKPRSTSSGTTEPDLCYRVRTITGFVNFKSSQSRDDRANVLSKAILLLRQLETLFTENGFVVQTIRIATNPFGEWMPVHDSKQTLATLVDLDEQLTHHKIEFCSLGSATKPQDAQELCPMIIETSKIFSCSADIGAHDIAMAEACAHCVKTVSQTTAPSFMKDGLGNFRFAVAACCVPNIPFFPVAKANQGGDEDLAFAIGLENGSLAQRLLSDCGSIANIPTGFRDGMQKALSPLQDLCESFEQRVNSNQNEQLVKFLGIDTSLNPSLDENGSVAHALEILEEVQTFGGPGSLAAASAITTTLQSLPGIKRVGYCGLMLPLCEDSRLAELSGEGLGITNLLSISSVCGVGIDTVPIPGDCTVQELKALFLDVSALAHRWNKSLSCRVFPLVSKKAGDSTTFDFPHMINAKVLPLGNSRI
ncbi:hypothetical protein ACA910_004135 [Epithemia clementina (nom. ined.)]